MPRLPDPAQCLSMQKSPLQEILAAWLDDAIILPTKGKQKVEREQKVGAKGVGTSIGP